MKTKPILNRKKLDPLVPIYTGKVKDEDVAIQLFSYNSSECIEDLHYHYLKFKGFENVKNQNWLNIHGLHQIEIIQKICAELGLHPLEIQDILDINQRPKFQVYDHHLFCSLKSIMPVGNHKIDQEQLSFILGKNFLVSFQERKADYFNHIRYRLNNDVGLIRSKTTDYLLFVLLESVLDNYYKTLNVLDANIEELGVMTEMKDFNPDLLKTIEQYKRQVHQIKQTIVPIKEFVSKIERENLDLILEKHLKYYYELKDICLSLVDNCEHLEVRLESYSNLFFSIQGHKMNQIMKTLTVVSSIFIPLTFVVGVYGMNFVNMPELKWKLGYVFVWIVMVLLLIIMLFYLKKKKWF